MILIQTSFLESFQVQDQVLGPGWRLGSHPMDVTPIRTTSDV